ncbi:VOC family protein [Denitratisoma sp. DHT3]|uniref:VOC family protein n=1 Tax=Denitratisoma sp. DHT3 TaxID=1981880 RepID=UPI001648D1B7|nr:VOC family protein [Denitratisoma sp. DHT3]
METMAHRAESAPVSTPAAAAAPAPPGLVGIKLVVDDLEASAAFYTAVFGMIEVERVKVDTGIRYPLDEIILSSGGAQATEFRLILLKYVGKAPPSRSDHILCFVVPDLDAVVEHLPKMGGKLLRPPQKIREEGSRMTIAADNAGNLLEIVQVAERAVD